MALSEKKQGAKLVHVMSNILNQNKKSVSVEKSKKKPAKMFMTKW